MNPLLVLTSLLPLFAQQPASTPASASSPARTAAAAHGALDPNQTICRRYRESGTRIAIRRTCMTRQEWTEFNRELRQNVDRAQLTRVMSK